MHHGTCVTRVPWCMSGSLTRDGGGKRSRHSRRMPNPQFYVFGKRPMVWRQTNDDSVIKWKHFPRYWSLVWGIHRWQVNSPHKGQWRRALMFSLICAWMNGSVNNREAGDLRRHRAHYDVIVMCAHDCLSKIEPARLIISSRPPGTMRRLPWQLGIKQGWVGLTGFLWWASSAKRKDNHGVSSGWSSTWFHSNTGLSSTPYELIPIIYLGFGHFGWLTSFFGR